MPKTNEQVVELDATAIEAIAKQVTVPEVDYDKLAEKLAEVNKLNNKKEEKEVNKLSNGESPKAVEGQVIGAYDKESKEEFTVKQFLAALSGNEQELEARNAHALKTLQEHGMIEKATYLNTGTGADGGYVVPNHELLADVLNILSTYSSVAVLPRVINLTNGTGLDVASLVADVVMTEVGSEGGSKAVTKPTLNRASVNVREFAGIALLTKKLIRQAVVDVYGILRDSFARAIAKTRESLLLVDATSGLINQSGIVSVAKATGNVSVNNIGWSDIKSLPFKLPVEAARGGVYVISRLLAAHLDSLQDTVGRDLDIIRWDDLTNMSGMFKNGGRFYVAETLGATDAVSTVHAVYGAFDRYAIVVRQGAIDSSVFDSGIVVDGSSVSHNLIQENKVAMRIETWENVGYPLPGAFVVLKTSAS